MASYKQTCIHCGMLVDRDVRVCSACGSRSPFGYLCPSCLRPVEKGQPLCAGCGRPLYVACPFCGKPTFVSSADRGSWSAAATNAAGRLSFLKIHAAPPAAKRSKPRSGTGSGQKPHKVLYTGNPGSRKEP